MPLVVRSIVILAILSGTASIAFAGDPFAKPASEEARQHLSRGNKLYSVRDFAKAIEEYKAGALAEQAPVCDYNLGQCYRQLGKYDAAKWHYQQFLRRGEPKGEVLNAVQNFIAQMDAELQKKAMSQPPTDAAPTESATEQPITNEEPVADRRDSQPQRLDLQDQGGPPSSPHRSFRALAWGLTGAGAVGLGIGGGLLWNASSLRDDANNTASQSDRQALDDRADTRSLVGTVIGISGGALLAAGMITFVLDKPSDSGSASAFSIGVSSRGVFAFGRF